MPAEYTKCRDAYISKGVPTKEAKARCAATFFKRHGVTVNEAKKKGMAADLENDEWGMVESIVGTGLGAKTPSITIEAAYGLAISERVSLGASDRPDFGEDGLITVIAARVGSSAMMKDPQTGSAKVVRWSEEALAKMAPTWIGGRVNPNHTPSDEGKIVTSRFDGKDLIQTFSPSKGLLEAMAHAWPGVGVSTEAAVSKLSDDGSTVLDGHGLGLAVVFYPMSPMCPPDKGCRILAGESYLTAAELWDVDDPEYWHESLKEELAEAAKLTTETREKLPGTAFCGPERSFPAHDAAHVRNGLARLNQSRFGPSTRAKIRTCLVRRAKKFDIEVSKGADMAEEHECTCGKADDIKAAEKKAEELLVKVQAAEAKVSVSEKELTELRAFRDKVTEDQRKSLLDAAHKLGANVQLQVFAALPIDALDAVITEMKAVAAKNEKAEGSGAGPTIPPQPTKETREDGALGDEAFIKILKAEAAALGRDPDAWVAEIMSKKVK